MTIYPILPDWRRITRKVGYGSELAVTDAWDPYYSYTPVIYNFEGLDGTTTIINSGYNSQVYVPTIGGTGKQQISTADKKYGGSSLYSASDTTEDNYIDIYSSTTSGLNFLTVEAWTNIPVSGLKPYINNYGNIAFSSYWSGGNTYMYLTTRYIGFGNIVGTYLVDTQLIPNQWQHHCLTQTDSYSFVTYHIDGVLIRCISTSFDLNIQRVVRDFSGYVDSLRLTQVSRGVAERMLPPGSSLADTGVATSFDPFYQYNKLICHFSQGLTDTSGWSNSLTSNGASISTSEYRFGPGSLDATAGYVSVDTNDAISSRLFINGGFKLSSSNIGNNVSEKHFDYTIECWVKVNASNMKAAVFTAGSNNNKDVVAFGIYTPTSTRTVIGTAQCPQNINAFILSSIDIPSNTWTHIAWSRKQSTLKIYINGTLCGDVAVDHGSYYLTHIGGQRNYNNTSTINLLGGYIDDLRVTTGIARYSDTGLTTPTTAFADCPYYYDKPAFVADSYPPTAPVLTGGATGSDTYYYKVLARCTFEGSNGSTSVSDLSNYARSVTNNRGVISTTKFKFGSSSIYYDGNNTTGLCATLITNVFSGKDLKTPVFAQPYGLSAEYNSLLEPWVIEWWANIDSSGNNMCIISNGAPYYSGTSGFAIYFSNGTLTLWSEGFYTQSFGNTSLVTNWCFYQLIADPASSSGLRLRVTGENGTLIANMVLSYRPSNVTNNLTIGSNLAGSVTFVGYIDDLRVTYGIARSTAVPTAAFPTY